MKKSIIVEFMDWLLINLIAPVIIPYIFVIMSKFIIKVNMSYLAIFMKLLENGVYTFVGIMLLTSLLQDYRCVKEAFTFLFWFVFTLSFLAIGFIFLSSLGIITGENAMTFNDNRDSFVVITILNVSLSMAFKYQMLKKKYQKEWIKI